ncbi:MAG TPA: shikimate kinase [Desulfurivibrionaceae bacterium]|nr:shikimate kinase [Desulfurivibrionaceae bacterium]
MYKPIRKIILVGFRATGKSSVGRLLAEHLGVEFLDMDEVLTARHGQISQVVAEHGWDWFRARERELLRELVDLKEGVIATGGGAVLHQELWPSMRESGLVVWLTSTLELICQRLGSDPASAGQRPSLTGRDIRTETATVLAEREPLYRAAAHLAVDSNRPVGEVAGEIEEFLRQGAGRKGMFHVQQQSIGG